MPSEDKWLLEYKPPEPRYKFKIPFVTPEYDPNLYYDVKEAGFPERAVNEPDYPHLFSLPSEFRARERPTMKWNLLIDDAQLYKVTKRVSQCAWRNVWIWS